jgi:hypothetical protein
MVMRAKPLVLGLLAAIAGTNATTARAMDSVKGEIVDLACYMGHPNPEKMRGPSHRKCADMCLKKGMPIGLVTDDKQVYLLLEDHDNPNPYQALKEKAAETVTVEGNKVSVGGSQGFVVEVLK